MHPPVTKAILPRGLLLCTIIITTLLRHIAYFMWKHVAKWIGHRIGSDVALDSTSHGLAFDYKHWSYVEVLGKLRIPHYFSPQLSWVPGAQIQGLINSCRLHWQPPKHP